MPKRIYVGNLPFDATEADVTRLFAGAGNVDTVALKRGDKKGSSMAVVDFAGDGPSSLGAFDGKQVNGRKIVVSTDREVVINHEEQY